MIVIEHFLGRSVEVPDDRRYHIPQGLWCCKQNAFLVFGLTQPALVLMGGIKDVDWLRQEGEPVQSGDSAIFAITGKILYLETPVSGTVHYHETLKEHLDILGKDPYGEGWLFKIRPVGDPWEAYHSLALPEKYLASLQASEGCKNPQGLKGGVSGICKAVYSGIGQQKLSKS